MRAAGRCRTATRRNARGVSLLEMILVLALIAIMGGLAAMVVTGGVEGMRLRSHSKELAAQLRFARAQAVNSGQPKLFVIDPVAHRWQGPNDRHGRLPDSLGIHFTGARQAQARAGEGGILFFPDGGSTGGRIELSAGQAVMRIDVAWLTGQVTVSRQTREPPA